ncbi:MAG: TraR/DksA family transcriptional regulator [Planctomycetales bacterium]
MARKEALLKILRSLQSKRESLIKKLTNDMDLTGAEADNTGDVCDMAMETEQHELHSQLAALESRELQQIETAIQQIRKGRYGLCESCGQKIPVMRLKALPFVSLCIGCQRKEEIYGRGYREESADWRATEGSEGNGGERDVALEDLELEL